MLLEHWQTNDLRIEHSVCHTPFDWSEVWGVSNLTLFDLKFKQPISCLSSEPPGKELNIDTVFYCYKLLTLVHTSLLYYRISYLKFPHSDGPKLGGHVIWMLCCDWLRDREQCCDWLVVSFPWSVFFTSFSTSVARNRILAFNSCCIRSKFRFVFIVA